MNTPTYRPPAPTSAVSVHTPPCNHRLSITLDRIIIAMEAEEHGVRRRVWQLAKQALEIRVPAWHATNGGAR